MLKTFLAPDSDTKNFVFLLSEALKLRQFTVIRDMTLAGLASSPSFTPDQKMAIKIIALQMDAGSMFFEADNVLLQILSASWDSDVEEMGVVALAPEQRAGIIYAIMDVCRMVIQQEIDRLTAVQTSPTVLPEDWNTPDEPEEPTEPA